VILCIILYGEKCPKINATFIHCDTEDILFDQLFSMLEKKTMKVDSLHETTNNYLYILFLLLPLSKLRVSMGKI
jgi:hypothetical protein